MLKHVRHCGHFSHHNVFRSMPGPVCRIIRKQSLLCTDMSVRLADVVGARRGKGEWVWGCFGSRPVHRGALWAMLCVSVSIHSRRGALSVLPRTHCQTPLPPPSMLLPRGQPAEWRMSLPGCLCTCVSHAHTHSPFYTPISRSYEQERLIFVGFFLELDTINVHFVKLLEVLPLFVSTQRSPVSQTLWLGLWILCRSSLSFCSWRCWRGQNCWWKLSSQC